MPCCEEQGIPKTCRSVCVGDYSLQTITEHYKCMDYTMQTLACISSGIGEKRWLLLFSSLSSSFSSWLWLLVFLGRNEPIYTRQQTDKKFNSTTISAPVELLPGQPKNVEVEPISPTQLKIDWLSPHQPTAVENYVINITELTSFDPNVKMTPPETKVRQNVLQ